MSNDEHEPKRRRSIALENVVATLIFIAGSIGTIVFLKRCWGLPFWVACVGGLIGFYVVAMVSLWMLSRRR